jgi:hypothetical protein
MQLLRLTDFKCVPAGSIGFAILPFRQGFHCLVIVVAG